MKKQDDQSTASRLSIYTGTPVIKFNKISVQLMDQYDIDKITAVGGVVAVEPVFNIDSAYVTRPGQAKYQANVTVARPGVNMVYVAGNGDNLTEGQAILPDGYRQALGFSTAQAAIGATINVAAINIGQPQKQPEIFSYTVKGVTRQSSMSLALALASILVSQDAAKQLNDATVEGTLAQDRFVAANVSLGRWPVSRYSQTKCYQCWLPGSDAG